MEKSILQTQPKKKHSLPDFKIRHLGETSSTNTLARQFAEEGAEEGLVLFADYQTDGRGKPGRKWLSPKGKDILVSILLRPAIPPHRAPLLTQVICRSVAAVLKKKYGISSAFKRPNDIMIGGKKICGVLVETVSNGSRLESVIIGIGLNVNSGPAESLPDAISIRQLKGHANDRDVLLKAILRQIRLDIKGFYAHPA